MSLSAQKQGVVPTWELVVSFVVSRLLPLETVFNSAAPPPRCDQCNRYLSRRLQPLLKLTPSSTHRMVPEGLGMSTDGFQPSVLVASELSDVINETIVFVVLSYTTAVSCLSEERRTVPQK